MSRFLVALLVVVAVLMWALAVPVSVTTLVVALAGEDYAPLGLATLFAFYFLLVQAVFVDARPTATSPRGVRAEALVPAAQGPAATPLSGGVAAPNLAGGAR